MSEQEYHKYGRAALADELRQKVTKAMDLCGAEYHCNTSCPYYDVGNCARSLMNDIHTLLKAQEPIEARLNLCDSCAKLYPKCDATADAIKFGCGVGNDNVIGCMAYVNRWKAQQPRVMTLEEVKRAEQDGEPLWIELLLYDRQNGWYMGRTVICSTLPPRHIMERNMERNQSRLVLTDPTYAKFWRCWTARPSKAEMEEAPW